MARKTSSKYHQSRNQRIKQQVQTNLRPTPPTPPAPPRPKRPGSPKGIKKIYLNNLTPLPAWIRIAQFFGMALGANQAYKYGSWLMLVSVLILAVCVFVARATAGEED